MLSKFYESLHRCTAGIRWFKNVYNPRVMCVKNTEVSANTVKVGGCFSEEFPCLQYIASSPSELARSLTSSRALSSLLLSSTVHSYRRCFQVAVSTTKVEVSFYPDPKIDVTWRPTSSWRVPERVLLIYMNWRSSSTYGSQVTPLVSCLEFVYEITQRDLRVKAKAI